MIAQQQILATCKIIQDYKHKIGNLTEEMNRLKQEVREGMVSMEWKSIRDPDIEVKCTQPFSFDLGLCKLEEFDTVNPFITEEQVISIKEIFDKKLFKKKYPELFDKYNTPLTPRLTIK